VLQKPEREVLVDGQASLVRVSAMRLTTTSRVSKARPLKFAVKWQKSRCSILFQCAGKIGKVV
jgi:hypothetical protein